MFEIMCYHCKELFAYDTNDIRPYIYHACKDGSMVGHKNPNYGFSKQRTMFATKKKIVHWRDFGE